MYQNGTGKDSLLHVLRSLDELTGIDRVVRSGQKVHFDIETKNGSIRWSMDADHTKYSSDGIQQIKGKGYTSLQEAINNLDAQATVDESIVILALAHVNEAKNFDGTFDTFWFSVDLWSVGMEDACYQPNFDNGVAIVEYPVVKITMTEAEYKCCASRIALYDEFAQVLYPIQECAYGSIGNLMDCECIFKYMSNVPLASANFLAERIARSKKEVRFVYRTRTEKVKPLISVVGTKYVMYPQSEFVNKACETIQNEGLIYRVASWSVTDELTKVDIVIHNGNILYQPVIELQTGDTLGSSMAVSVYICMGKGKMLLHRNSAYHWASFEKQGGVKSLFDGIFDALESFERTFNKNMDKTIHFDASKLQPFVSIVGKKRFSLANTPVTGDYVFHDLIYRVVNGLYCDLNPRWAQTLAEEYTNFYNLICAAIPDDETALDGGVIAETDLFAEFYDDQEDVV